MTNLNNVKISPTLNSTVSPTLNTTVSPNLNTTVSPTLPANVSPRVGLTTDVTEGRTKTHAALYIRIALLYEGL